MPELPEVEVTKQGILPHIIQQQIIQVVVRQPKLRWPIPDLHSILAGNTVVGVRRRAKYLLFDIATGVLLVHLGMTGCLQLLHADVLPNKHDHVDIVLGSGHMLRFTDPRRFGALLWIAGEPFRHHLLQDLGVEPLVKQFNAQYLWQHAQLTGMPIKAMLMHNRVVVGIGNIYATEALFAAQVYPAMSAKVVSLEQLAKIVRAIKYILHCAIRHGGTTIKNFLNSDGRPGYFVQQLKVYGRSGMPCVRCGSRLQAMRIAQRNTVYCPHCQHADV